MTTASSSAMDREDRSSAWRRNMLVLEQQVPFSREAAHLLNNARLLGLFNLVLVVMVAANYSANTFLRRVRQRYHR